MRDPDATYGSGTDTESTDDESGSELTDVESSSELTDVESSDEPSAEPTDAASSGPTDRDRVENRRLPPAVAENLRTLFGTEDRPGTFGAWTDAVAAAFGDDWPPALADLCHDEEGRHRAEVGTGTEAETYRFVCVLDAVMLPFLTDGPVEVRSEGPQTGEVVTSHVSRDGIETDPEDAVLSFGVAAVEPDAEVTPRRTYESLCPYVHAFPDRDAYERWDGRVDAPTTALPLSDGLALARALVLTGERA